MHRWLLRHGLLVRHSSISLWEQSQFYEIATKYNFQTNETHLHKHLGYFSGSQHCIGHIVDHNQHSLVSVLMAMQCTDGYMFECMFGVGHKLCGRMDVLWLLSSGALLLSLWLWWWMSSFAVCHIGMILSYFGTHMVRHSCFDPANIRHRLRIAKLTVNVHIEYQN